MDSSQVWWRNDSTSAPLSACSPNASADENEPIIRRIITGRCEGQALVSPVSLSFFGGVDAATGIVAEPGHPLQGQSVAGRVLVFPTAKGSTVGSYILYRLGRCRLRALSTPKVVIVAVGAIMADVPMRIAWTLRFRPAIG
jgi:predicted aconitase with swiveling domain